jgi:hypothetical protein
MKTLIFNTTTNGFLGDAGPSSAPALVGIACLLEDDDRHELDRYSSIVKLPKGTAMIPAAAKFHGITTAISAEGRSLYEAMEGFVAVAGQADRIVAFNLDFHLAVIVESVRKTKLILEGNPEWFDPMRQAVSICRIPDRTGNYKFPKLGEAYSYFVHEPLGIDLDQGPLDVLDQHLRAIQRVYHGIQDHKPADHRAAMAARDIIP